MGQEGDEEEFTRLCYVCSSMCYKSEPLWQWNQQTVDAMVGRGKLHALHSQILLFYQSFQEQAPSQTQIRKAAVSAFRRSAHCLWPYCQVHTYGSSATGLFLASSDIDLVIVNTGCTDTLFALETLEQHLSSTFKGRISALQVLRNARVPIVRFWDKHSKFHFDVRVVCTSTYPPELRAVQLIKDSLVELPAMGPLYILLKMFLHEKGLDQLYEFGGVRPYMLFVMLCTFLRLAQDSMGLSEEESPNLALLLLGFLQFYGSCFESRRYGISCRSAGVLKCFFFSKQREVYECGYCPIVEKSGFYHPKYPHLLAVEDPLTPSNDLGKISRDYQEIQQAFNEAFIVLQTHKSKLLHSFIPTTLANDDADLGLSFSRLRC